MGDNFGCDPDRAGVNCGDGVMGSWIHSSPRGRYTPGILYEFENKGVAEFAFRKCMKKRGINKDELRD